MKITIDDKTIELGKTVVFWCEKHDSANADANRNAARIYAGAVVSAPSEATFSVVINPKNGAQRTVQAREVHLTIEQPIKELRNVFDNINHWAK